ncbi:TetR/AcrR family transcriptional regulator [Zhihengliuella flava]|uniref:AcrR family transcriptional regulator n=1 Tax=Zhihengliuella flava TaxID=1285193 RepID=A0A931DBR9_9MICC|nr:TetR/AcrR family transcriptional regulator [Zhihengliuella flava]MBG6084521.1 AcrR family transcriptional regulator [Zhihengliuella flava]
MSAAQHDGVVRRPARTNATRLKIFEASLALIGQRGHHAVTVDEIAAAAGVSKGSVYYNFGSKSDLIGQLLRFGTDILLDRLHAAAGPASDSARERMAAMVRAALLFVEDYPAFAQLWISEMWREPSDWREVLVTMRADVLGVVRESVAAVFAERGAVHGPHIAETVDVTASAIFGSTLLLARDRQVFAAEHSVEACVRTILGSLDAAPASR